MATASKIEIRVDTHSVYCRAEISSDAAKTASELLQENHDSYHIFFNQSRFHNHISHHLCTLLALGASPGHLKQAYKDNVFYQRPQTQPRSSIVHDLDDPDKFIQHLGPPENYASYLKFFEQEIDRTGWQQVLQKYVFADDERAHEMFVRMFAGILHPIIHVGFGVEFDQPALVAEGLAEMACHEGTIGKLLLPSEQSAEQHANLESPTLVALLERILVDEELQQSAHSIKGQNFASRLPPRARDRMIEYCAQVRVKPSELAEKTAEMTNAVAYYTAAAQRSDKAIKYDFYFIHALNSSIFLSAFLKQDWLSDANKVRLLEWKIRMDLIMFVQHGSPQMRLQDIRGYRPNHPSGWHDVEERVCALSDDGHAAKLVRAIAHGQRICAPYEASDHFPLKHDDWLQLAHMAIDSVEGAGPSWIRSAGFDEAWVNVGPRL